MENAKKPIIAAFDFDHTISTKDTLIPFFCYIFGYPQTVKQLGALTPSMIGYLFKKISRQKMKEKILTRFFAGKSAEQLKEYGDAFAYSSSLEALIRPAAKKRIDWHKSQQHTCVILSAGIDLYLAPWGKMSGFDHVIASSLEIDAHGKATGRLQGANCWGIEKVRRLNEVLGPRENYLLYAYGDSQGDKELLALADYPFYKAFPA